MCNNPAHESLPDVRENVRIAAASKGFCVKCKTERASLLLRQAAFCKECFFESFTSNFRVAIGKQRVTPAAHSENILVEFDASPASKALLWACLQLCKNEPQRKTNNCYVAVYVENPNRPSKQQAEITGFVVRYLQAVGVSFVVVKAEDFGAEMHEYLHARPKTLSQDARVDAFAHLKRRKLFEVAKTMQCVKIYLAQTSSDIAIKTIELTAKGRGFMLPFDVGGPFSQNSAGHFEPMNDSQSSIVAIRPLMTHSTKEVVLLCHFKGLLSDETSLVDDSILRDTNPNQQFTSIFEKTKAFIIGLERDFPSTVSTVAKTAAKITTGVLDDGCNTSICQLCTMPFPSGADEWFSNTTIEALPSANQNNSSEVISKFNPNFCYGCNLLRGKERGDV